MHPRRPQETLKMPTWSPKLAQDAQVGGPRRLKDLNLEAQNAPRSQVRGPERFKDPTCGPEARHHGFQDVPRGSQEALKRLQEAPQEALKDSKKPPRGSKRLANASQERLGSEIVEETLKNLTLDDRGDEEQINR